MKGFYDDIIEAHTYKDDPFSYDSKTYDDYLNSISKSEHLAIIGITDEVKQMSEEKTKKLPEKVFQAGQIKASVWKNDRKEGQDYDTFSVKVTKSYTLDEGKTWNETSNYNLNDLPKVELVTKKAYEYLALKE